MKEKISQSCLNEDYSTHFIELKLSRYPPSKNTCNGVKFYTNWSISKSLASTKRLNAFETEPLCLIEYDFVKKNPKTSYLILFFFLNFFDGSFESILINFFRICINVLFLLKTISVQVISFFTPYAFGFDAVCTLCQVYLPFNCFLFILDENFPIKKKETFG